MNRKKALLLGRIEQAALWAADDLQDELHEAPQSEKEAIEAGIEFETWLAKACRQTLGKTF